MEVRSFKTSVQDVAGITDRVLWIVLVPFVRGYIINGDKLTNGSPG